MNLINPADYEIVGISHSTPTGSHPASECPGGEDWPCNLTKPTPEPSDLDNTDICPTHGRENITGTSSTRGTDPYTITELACGCDTVAFSKDDVHVIRASGQRRPVTENHYDRDYTSHRHP